MWRWLTEVKLERNEVKLAWPGPGPHSDHDTLRCSLSSSTSLRSLVTSAHILAFRLLSQSPL